MMYQQRRDTVYCEHDSKWEKVSVQTYSPSLPSSSPLPNLNLVAQLNLEIWRGAQNKKKWRLMLCPDVPSGNIFTCTPSRAYLSHWLLLDKTDYYFARNGRQYFYHPVPATCRSHLVCMVWFQDGRIVHKANSKQVYGISGALLYAVPCNDDETGCWFSAVFANAWIWWLSTIPIRRSVSFSDARTNSPASLSWLSNDSCIHMPTNVFNGKLYGQHSHSLS